jgi:hypothetical protein
MPGEAAYAAVVILPPSVHLTLPNQIAAYSKQVSQQKAQAQSEKQHADH